MELIKFWLIEKPKWWAYLLWRKIGIRVWRLPIVLEYNNQGRIQGITFTSSLEQAQQLKDFWERRDYYLSLPKELEVAQNQIVELESQIKPAKAAKK